MHLRRLELATRPLADQTSFYTRLLGADPLVATDEEVEFAVGSSRLSFRQNDAPARYHFAFNIPENRFDDARAWIQNFAPLIADGAGRTVFSSPGGWNAHILYFVDPAGNIGELIARHKLDNADAAPFSGRSLLCVSEIGIAADDVGETGRALCRQTGAEPYYGADEETFMPIGDEHGLLILVKQGRIWFPDTGVPALHLPLRVEIENEGRETVLTFPR
ncbi:MAG: hypothetical protein H6642_05100 [Caldilineaceae bacterium]|nr:hypothetical protein [Caldilineaceae bacterium]